MISRIIKINETFFFFFVCAHLLSFTMLRRRHVLTYVCLICNFLWMEIVKYVFLEIVQRFLERFVDV